MIPEPKPMARILVIESSKRWQLAMFRFAKHLVPSPLTPEVQSIHPGQIESSQIRGLLRSPQPSAIFWEIGSTEHESQLASIATLSTASPQVAQIVVGESAEMTRPSSALLAELGVDAFIRHPELLLRWRHFFLGHFARTAMDLD